MGFINYQAIDIYYFFSTKLQKKQISQSEVLFVRNWFQKNHGKINKNKLTGIGKGLNLIIIQVESLQNFVVGMKWQGNEVTPNINRLLKSGMYYKQIYDQTSAGNTSDATFLANCSLYPSRKGAVSFLYAQNSFYCLPQVLNEYGYTTMTMQSYKKSFWNSATFDRALGFQHQFYEDQYVEKEKFGGFLKGLSDKSFLTQSLEKLKMVQAPFYAFLITLSSHSPFAHITPDIDDFQLNKLENTIIGYYMRAMHYVDSAIGDFLKQMEEHNLMSNTVIIIYGDHRARIPKNELRRIGIYDQNEERKIPLFIYIPNHKYGYKSETIGGHIDIAPTICNILGIDESDKYFMGKDLSGKNDGYVIFRDGTFICGEYCSVNEALAKHNLLISDLVIEKDIIPLLTR
jgi:phosphoglycerol transferase MdoB-like AlkP superfamily enzyme